MNKKITLKIEGMSCGHCKNAVEKAIKTVLGVSDAQVDLEKKEAIVTGSVSSEELVRVIEEANYVVVATYQVFSV